MSILSFLNVSVLPFKVLDTTYCYINNVISHIPCKEQLPLIIGMNSYIPYAHVDAYDYVI
jgi:hypothetical protein